MANSQLRSATDLFEDMGAKVASASQSIDDGDTKIVEEIESLCMNCHDDGITKLLLTRIPFFREIVIMSFDCPHCGFRNAEVQPAGEIQQKGHKYTFKVLDTDNLNRQVVKSDTCIFRVETLDLEIPPGRGQLTNLEGILSMIASDLDEAQEQRKEVAPAMFEKIQEIISALKSMAAGNRFPFTVTIDDPAGNSWIEPSTSDKAGQYIRSDYNRTPAQNESLGLSSSDPSAPEPIASDSGSTAAAPEQTPNALRPEYRAAAMQPALPPSHTVLDQDRPDDSDEIIENQVYSFPASCPGCNHACATNMKMVSIPHFKQVVLMSTVCSACGYRSNEVKTGGEIPALGRLITLQIRNALDLSRDILKSESCALECPELELRVEPGTLGGRFTTVEGLLTQVRDDLRTNIFSTPSFPGERDPDISAAGGDSMPAPERARWDTFFARLDAAIAGETQFTIVLRDPLAGSYVQSLTAPEPDPQVSVSEYERSEEEEEDLGLRDIKVEGYEEDGEAGAGDGGGPDVDEVEKAKRFLEKTTGARVPS